jgi:hypothetical protein
MDICGASRRGNLKCVMLSRNKDDESAPGDHPGSVNMLLVREAVPNLDETVAGVGHPLVSEQPRLALGT